MVFLFSRGAMMIDPNTENLLSLAEAAKSLPGRPNVTTVWRWRNRGVRGVKLETVCIGGRRFTSREALARFCAATTAAADGEPVRSETPRQRERAIERAEREAKRLGV
jgi:hypothetical protein